MIRLRTVAACALACAALVPSTGSAEITVSGRYLKDVWGGVIGRGIRGVNDSTSYPDAVVEQSAQTGANCTRIYWTTNDGRGIAKLDNLLGRYHKAKTFVMPSVWNATGKAYSSAEFTNCVNFWVNNKATIQKHKDYLLLNIANEPGLASEDFVGRYKSAITTLRNAGYNCPLVIDAPNYARDVNKFFEDSNGNGVINAQELINHDPRKAIVFSWHIYDPKDYRYGTRSQIGYWLQRAVNANLCFIVGEFSWKEFDTYSSKDVEWRYIMQTCHQQNVGWLAWEWYRNNTGPHHISGNGNYGTWANSPWGQEVAVSNAYSIKNTSARTSYLNAAP